MSLLVSRIIVTVYSIEDISKELCGESNIKNTSKTIEIELTKTDTDYKLKNIPQTEEVT